MYIDHNSTIREIFSQVAEVSQHGLDELFDDEVTNPFLDLRGDFNPNLWIS